MRKGVVVLVLVLLCAGAAALWFLVLAPRTMQSVCTVYLRGDANVNVTFDGYGAEHQCEVTVTSSAEVSAYRGIPSGELQCAYEFNNSALRATVRDTGVANYGAVMCLRLSHMGQPVSAP